MVNYMHPPSMLSWLNVRKICQNVGHRFQIRMQIYAIIFLNVMVLLFMFILSVSFGFIRPDILD